MTITIIFLPLITYLLLTLFSTFIGRSAKFIAVLLPFSLLIEMLWYYYDHLNQTVIVIIGNWLSISHLQVLWNLILSPFTLITSFIIILLSTLIQIYSLSYMETDLNIILFMAYMSLFTFLMTFFIYTNSLILNLVGWEGVGLLSYLLINFWNFRIEANKSSLKAIFINKFGDICFLLSIVFMFNLFLTTNTTIINTLAIYIQLESFYFIIGEVYIITIVTFFLILAGITKSAQLIFNLWLPDAMEGPTPVSSLIHSATMVAAGFLLLIKYNGLLEQTTVILPCLFLIGAVTSLISSLEGVCLFDHKSVLAGSTCDQLGLMFIIYGCGNINLAFFQFCTHAFYKSLLFLSLGALIHQTGEQESRLMSIIPSQTPIIIVCYQSGLFALLGFPGIISHYSKALILNTIYIQGHGTVNFVWVFNQFIQTLTNLNTLFGAIGLYCILDSLSFRKKQLKQKAIYQNSYVKIPLLILSILVLSIGIVISSVNNSYELIPVYANNLRNYWINSYFIPNSGSVFGLTSLILILYFSYYSYNVWSSTTINPVTNKLINLPQLNLYTDWIVNYISNLFIFFSYDIGYLALNNSLFNLNFYLRYSLYYNYFLNKLYYKTNLSWLWVSQITFIIIILVILI